MSRAAEFRKIAERHRRAASRASLPLVRQMKLEAAERLEVLADETERFEITSHICLTQQVFE